MKNKYLIAMNILLLLGMGYCIYKITNIPKVRYVKSAELVYGFAGMKEAQKIQTKNTEEIQANVDTLQIDFQKAVSHYNLNYQALSKDERAQQERLLSMQQENLQKYAKNAQQKIKEKDEEITQGVLNQVNSFVEEYGKAQGYDIVLGTTTSGNLLFGTEGLDVTEEILQALNDQYQSSPTDIKK